MFIPIAQASVTATFILRYTSLDSTIRKAVGRTIGREQIQGFLFEGRRNMSEEQNRRIKGCCLKDYITSREW